MRRRLLASLLVTAMTALAAVAAPPPEGASRTDVIAGPVAARVVRVIDGDTLVVRARIWLGQEVETRVRVFGVNAPELAGSCAGERDQARAARELIEHLVGGREVLLGDVRYDKYGGRVVARVRNGDGADVAEALLEAGLAHAYAGGRREPWCERGRAR